MGTYGSRVCDKTHTDLLFGRLLRVQLNYQSNILIISLIVEFTFRAGRRVRVLFVLVVVFAFFSSWSSRSRSFRVGRRVRVLFVLVVAFAFAFRVGSRVRVLFELVVAFAFFPCWSSRSRSFRVGRRVRVRFPCWSIRLRLLFMLVSLSRFFRVGRRVRFSC